MSRLIIIKFQFDSRPSTRETTDIPLQEGNEKDRRLLTIVCDLKGPNIYVIRLETEGVVQCSSSLGSMGLNRHHIDMSRRR